MVQDEKAGLERFGSRTGLFGFVEELLGYFLLVTAAPQVSSVRPESSTTMSSGIAFGSELSRSWQNWPRSAYARISSQVVPYSERKVLMTSLKRGQERSFGGTA